MAASLYYYGVSNTTNEGIEAPLCRAQAGNLVHTRVRLADNFINGTTAPAIAQWEGPYIRIYPDIAGIDAQGRGPSKITKWAKGERQSVVAAAIAAGYGEPVSNSGLADCNFADDFFYEVDLIGCKPIYLPFDATLKLYTQFAGLWLVDTMVTLAQEAAIPALITQEYAQTRKVPPTVTRRIRVPTGAINWQYSGGYAPAGTLDFDQGESAKAAAGGNNSINDFMYVAAGGATAPGPQPIGGARVFTVTGAVAGSICVTFGIRL